MSANAIAWVVIAMLALLLVPAIRWGRSQAKGNLGGAMLMLGAFFSGIFDPATKSASEQLDRRNKTGDAEKDKAGAPPAYK